MVELINDYLGHIDYDRDGYTSCSESGCDDEGICRCYKITSIYINHIDLNSLALAILREVSSRDINGQRDKKLTTLIHGYNPDEVNLYCIHRILTINKLYDPENWEITWSDGYYGDELNSGKINQPLFNQICSQIGEVINFDKLKDKINYVLSLEYGHLLEELIDKEYEIITVSKSDLVFGQDKHYNKVLIEDKRYYNDYPNHIPHGICHFKNGKWRVIDGYHRLSNYRANNVRIIGIK
jgi:hypothetical protein